MTKASRPAARKKHGGAKPLYLRLLLPMILITVFQLVVFIGFFVFSGEFTYIRKYAYDSFSEKNANRKSYIENLFNQKNENVYNSALEINDMVRKVLNENDADIGDIKTDKELNRAVLSKVSPILIQMLRQSQVNDAFVILDSGELYYQDGSQDKSVIYIRDNDPTQSSVMNNDDLLMELGNSNIAKELGVTLDFEWSARLDVSDMGSDNMAFYYNTIETAKAAKSSTPLYELGYWTGFSRVSRSAEESIKYTLPLIADDGTVYGVMGIGMTEKLIQDFLPVNDYFHGQMCFILCADFNNNGEYVSLMHSGPMYNRLVNEKTVLSKKHRIEGDIYDFNPDSDIESIGNIQDIKLYDSGSEFKSQKWALASIGNKDGIMSIYTNIVRLFILSCSVSLTICLIGSLIISRRYTSPVSKMIARLDSSGHKNSLVEFETSTIKEIDLLGEAITRLQINVTENASRVSKIIGMVDMGIGVFMYSYADHSVFIGESLVDMFDIEELPKDSDSIISFEEFVKYVSRIDTENKICSDLIFRSDSEVSEHNKKDIEISVTNHANGEKAWYKFSITRDKSNVIGLVRDVTNEVIEKQRIEYERDYDVTTGLLNRRAYLNRLDALFSNPKNMRTAAVIMIDLDNLKYVNDTYGHDYGDDYIRAAANVFKEFKDYGGLVSRLSGDEFNICLSGFNSKDEIREIVNKVQMKLMESACILADGTKYKVRASGGISWYPDDADNYEMLIKYADFAMYSIKHSIKGSIAEFDMKSYKKDAILMTGIEEMNRIIEEESVKFAFQPIVSARDGSLYGYEALMRPQSQILKTPLDLIRIARTGAKLYEIEHLTWINGLKSFREHIESGDIPAGSKVFINSLSSCLINQSDIKYIDDNFGTILSNIVLEVLESETENEKFTDEKLKLIESWNARIALDDFGTGFNSEYLLIKLEPDIIKLDRSIISGCDRDENRRGVVASLIRMAKSRNITVLAEGVETSGELETVINCGVDLIQGYYIGYPLLQPTLPDKYLIDEIERINSETDR